MVHRMKLLQRFKMLCAYPFADDRDRFMICRALYHNCKSRYLRAVYKRLYDRNLRRNGSSIPITLAHAPFFPHGVKGIFISEKAKIGKDCVIFHQVTIGSNTLSGSKRRGSPTVGDHVYIGAGAKIIGNVTVGNSARIGANCVVVEDIPNNSTVVMPKPVIIERDSAPDNTFRPISEWEACE